MVNLRKCKFLTEKAAILGLELTSEGFALGLKFLGNLCKVAIPTTLRELQAVVGKLMYAAPHIPHFKARIKPIEALLSAKGRVLWDEQCTAALNDLLRCIYARVRLVSGDPYGSFVMYPSVVGDAGFVACL